MAPHKSGIGRWNDADAAAAVERFGRDGVSADLALRIYSCRLLGADPALVLHGGGNCSVKTEAVDLLGACHAVLAVKGSGADMATIGPAGFPEVRLQPVLALRRLERLADEDMVAFLRGQLMDPASPNPSVETLLHAFLPHKFVDHTHATAVLAIIDQEDGADRAREVFGARVAVVPYIMPGFALAKAAAEAFEAAPQSEGLILDKHGIFTFGASAREAYERMIGLVAMAEAHIAGAAVRRRTARALPKRLADVAHVAPIVRGAIAAERGGGLWQRQVLEFRAGDAVLDFVNGRDLAEYATRGVVTPDHIIRIKNKPLILPPPEAGSLAAFAAATRAAVARYAADYLAYFRANAAAMALPPAPLDPLPRLVLVPGLGLFGLGKSAREAAIAADVAEAMLRIVGDAEAIGRYTALPESELFKMEYWPLELAKLGKAEERPLQRQVAAITGGGGAIGAATARLFARNGAEVAILDIDGAKAEAVARGIGGAALALGCDVTDPAAVAAAFDAVVRRFGGLDILVSNAGAAWQGRIGDVADEVLRRSFELNFFAHQRLAQAAVRVMLAQGTGGALLFNVSKQAVNPGRDFGPYGLAKAATLFLSRQYALDYGEAGIRANAVNADRIRSGLLTDGMIAERAQARGVDPARYMAGNLLGEEVTAEDVALAFLHQALALKTTGGVTTVDGGNIAAALR